MAQVTVWVFSKQKGHHRAGFRANEQVRHIFDRSPWFTEDGEEIGGMDRQVKLYEYRVKVDPAVVGSDRFLADIPRKSVSYPKLWMTPMDALEKEYEREQKEKEKGAESNKDT